jgi:Na+-driven multidrug efflux pump
MILQSLLIAVSGGVCIFISQYYGADDHEKGQGLFDWGFVLAGFRRPFCFTGQFVPASHPADFVADPVTIGYGTAYLNYVRFSYLPFAVSFAMIGALRSVGSTRLPFIIGSFGVALNTVLELWFDFRPFWPASHGRRRSRSGDINRQKC